jgi:signal peptidase I
VFIGVHSWFHEFMIRWLISKTVRQAGAMRKHVHKLLQHQRDILSPKAIAEVEASMKELDDAVAAKADKTTLEKKMDQLEKTANQCIKLYPNAAWRENAEVLLVALAVAMGIRTFFLQPFKIPTGSMQPTLFGVTSENLIDRPDFKIPTGLERVKEWFQGISYIDIKAKADGSIDRIDPPLTLKFINIKQTFWIDGVAHTIWFPPDFGESRNPGISAFQDRTGLSAAQVFHKGEQVIRLQVRAGDHLFVDRVTYNFRPARRGDIVVFETKGIPEERRIVPGGWNIPPDQFYIKRLVGLGGETIQIGKDRHLVINGKELDASTPHFENLYSFDPKEPVRDSQYSGHAPLSPGRPCFLEDSATVQIPPGHVMVMGDNTFSSLDSRYWGDFPATSIIGKSFFVYWPITTGANGRFGWGQR